MNFHLATTRARLQDSDMASHLMGFEAMCCREVAKLPEGPEWIYEMKWHGCRVVGMKMGQGVMLATRNHLPLGSLFPLAEQALAGLQCDHAVVDGQLVALDGKGQVLGCPLELLREGQVPARLQLQLFDLLECDGLYLQGLPCEKRKLRLQALVAGAGEAMVVVGELTGNGVALLKQALDVGQPGVVAKRKDASYEEGARSGAWVKCLVPQGLAGIGLPQGLAGSLQGASGEAGSRFNDPVREKAA